MAVYFQGAEAEDFVLSAAGSCGNDTSTGYNNANARCSVVMNTTSYMDTTSFSASDFWTHAVVFHQHYGSPSQTTHFEWWSGGTPRLAYRDEQGTNVLMYWNGSSWVAAASQYTGYNYTDNGYGSGTKKTVDFYIKIGISGASEFRVYYDGVPVISTTAIDMTFGGTVSAIDKVRFRAYGTYYYQQNGRYSEVIIADYVTLGSKLLTLSPNGAGNYTGWTTGAYTDIDEAYADGLLATSGTINQRLSTAFSDLSALGSGESITSLKVSAYVSKDAGGPQSINYFARVSATDYDGSDQSAPSAGMVQHPNQIWTTDPNTSAAWTVSGVNAAEFGVRSRT